VPSQASGDTALLRTVRRVAARVGRALAFAAWATVTSLATAAGCWCCGFTARDSWLRMRPESVRDAAVVDPADQGVVTGAGDEWMVETEVALEVEIGIRQIEAYLARVT
jgi:hypothetical protein